MTSLDDRLVALVAHSADALLLLDAAGRVEWGSLSTPALIGVAPGTLTGTPFVELIDPRDHDAWHRLLGRLADAAPHSFEFRCRHHGTPERWIEGIVRNFLADPRIHGLEVRCHDVTARRQAERERPTANQAPHETDRVRLEEQLRQAQTMAVVGRLAGGIGHDFNNLLAAIRGNAELLHCQLGADSPMASETSAILDASDRAVDLTRRLLAFGRKQVRRPVPLNLSDVIARLAPMALRMVGTDITMTLDLDPALPPVMADSAQLEQMFVNLVANARDAVPASGGRIHVQTTTATLSESQATAIDGVLMAGVHVRLTVTDNGLGLDEPTRSRMFEPFFTTKEPGRGTGLGLSTIDEAVRETGGAIVVESDRGQGASFIVYLPAFTGAVA